MSIEILRELTEAMEIASNGGGINFYEYAKSGREAIAELEKREPAAWGLEHPNGDIIDVITPEEHAKKEGQYTVALYRGREWVGLTDEEIELLRDMIDWSVGWSYIEFARAAEAKLKELNT
jgi:hypothetical protein